MSSRTQIVFIVSCFSGSNGTWSTRSILLRIRLNSDHQLCRTVQKRSGRRRRNIYCDPKNAPGLKLAVTWPELNRSSKFFHC